MVEDIVMTSLVGALILNACIGKKKKSPLIWLVFGCICILAYSYDMWSWSHSPLLDIDESIDPIIKEQVKQSVMNEYRSALIRVVVGVLVVLGSTFYLIRNKKFEPGELVNASAAAGKSDNHMHD